MKTKSIGLLSFALSGRIVWAHIPRVPASLRAASALGWYLLGLQPVLGRYNIPNILYLNYDCPTIYVLRRPSMPHI